MDMLKKKAEVTKMVMGVVWIVIGLVLVLTLLAALWPTLSGAFGNISAQTDFPLVSLFSKGGVIAIIFVVGILIGILYFVFKGMGNGNDQ